MSVRNRVLGPPVIKMPTGLVEIMDGLARDVLKNNPENIYEFCARHMQTLLEIRDGRALRPLMTLDQKIKNAQKKVKQRAEERRLAYDIKVTEDVSKQQALTLADTPYCVDDSEYSEKHKTEKISKDVQPEEKENITKLIEEQEPKKGVVLVGDLQSEINDKNDVLNKLYIKEMEENKDNETKSNLQIFTIIDSDKTENTPLVTEDKCESVNTIKYNGTGNNIKNDLAKENQSNISYDSNKGVNHNVTEALSDEAAIKFESNDNMEEKILSPQDNDIILLQETNEIIQNNAGTDLQDIVETNMNDMSDEIYTTDATEKTILLSDNNLQDNPHVKQMEKQTDNSLNGNNIEIPLNVDTNDNLANKKAGNLNESEKSKDNQNPTFIQGSENDENVSLHNNKPDTDLIQSNELDAVEIIVTESVSNEQNPISEKRMDTESVPESGHDNDKINNINSSMDLETAAITIQKVFRSFLFKTKTASYDDPTPVDIALLTEEKEKEDNEVLNIKDRRHVGISRMDTVLQTVNEEKSLSLSTDDSSTLSSAATVIQAHVRGFLVRNKLNLNKTISSNSLIDSDAPSIPSLDADSDNMRSKTVLNIHIVPEGGHFVSRDESILTSMDLSLDSSPPSSVNLHPLGYDKSERRKQLKREDAIQSVSPPSNNSGKLSEEHDSVKDVLIESNAGMEQVTVSENSTLNVVEKEQSQIFIENDSNMENPTSDGASDEMDVITPFIEDRSSRESDHSTKLLHSGEFHDIVVPTNVTRSDTSVVRGE